MATKVHGTIRARNRETGRYMEIRPDMLDIEGHPWVIEQEVHKPIGAKDAEKLEAKASDDIIYTKEGKPFKTEQAARMGMKRNGLSDEDYVIIKQTEDEFIIKKV